MSEPEIPTARQLRWPILVVLDQGGAEDPVLELPERVARHLGLAAGALDGPDAEIGRPLLTERVWKAVVDLYQAGAVDGSEDASQMWITDAGRRLTESDVMQLDDSGVASSESTDTEEDRPSIGSWIATLLDMLSSI